MWNELPSVCLFKCLWHGFVTAALWKYNTRRYSAVPAQVSSVGNKLCCPAGFPVVEVRPHHSAPSRTSLIEDGEEDWLQACSPCLQVSAGSSTVASCWRTSWAGGFRGTMSTTFSLVIIASHPSYAVINRQWPSFSGCCGSCLEQSTAVTGYSATLAAKLLIKLELSWARHTRAVTASLPQSPQDTSLQALLPVTMFLPEKWHRYFRTR